MSDSTPAATAEQAVLITRIFDAPREAVFQAWTEPDEVAAWFGPESWDTPHVHIDLREGGRYELTMVRRDGGAQYTLGYDVLEVVEPELIVLRSDPMPEAGVLEPTVVRIELHDHGAKTRMTFSDAPHPPAGRKRAEAGWLAAFEKLNTHVAAMS